MAEGSAAMSSFWTGMLFLAIFVPLDVLILWALFRGGWSILGDKYPPAEIAADAVRRDFQSVAFDFFNFGLCVHVAVDDRHLHLIPSGLIRWAGPRRISVPWEEIALKRLGQRWGKARVGTLTLTAPVWALRLAEREEPSAAA
jgi:hypothetical protein